MLGLHARARASIPPSNPFISTDMSISYMPGPMPGPRDTKPDPGAQHPVRNRL